MNRYLFKSFWLALLLCVCQGIRAFTVEDFFSVAPGVSITVNNDPTYPWAVDDAGVMYSTMHVDNGSATIGFVNNGTEAVEVTFERSVSSESGCDRLGWSTNGSSYTEASGSYGFSTRTLTLPAGSTLSFRYRKNSSGSSGSDCGYIRNLQFGKASTYTDANGSQWGYIAYGNGATATITSYSGNDFALTVPAAIEYNGYSFPVEAIGNNIFKDNKNLTSVTLPASLKTLGSAAFQGCTNLISVNIPDALTSIGSSAFEGCSSLATVLIPGNSQLKTISSRAFYGCSLLSSFAMPAGVTSLGSYAFYNCSKLTSIAIPDGLTTIPESAFYGCSALKSVSISDDAALTTIGNLAFCDCRALTDINFPASLETIGGWAFATGSYNSNTVNGVLYYYPNSDMSLPSIDLSKCSALKTIGARAFLGTKATKIDLSGCSALTTIGAGAFTGNYYVTEVDLSGCTQLTAIPETAFCQLGCNVSGECTVNLSGCTALTSIDQVAFYAAKMTAIDLSGCSALQSIGASAFDATSLDKIVVDSETPPALSGAPFNGTAFIFVPTEKVGTYKTEWSDYASRIFPQTSLETVARTTARDGAPALLDAIGGVGHEDQIVSLKVEGTINGYDIMLMRNKLLNLRYLDLSDATIVPEASNYQYYTGYYTQQDVLGAYSFYQVDNLRTVVLPKNITSVGSYAFAKCANLTQVTGMPESCTSIDSYAFYGGDDYGYSCYSPKLTHVDIGEQVQTIGSYAFSGCWSLNNVKIPASVKAINSYAFAACYRLSTIDFAEGLETIGETAFYGCSSLRKLQLPTTLKTVGSFAFQSCNYLSELRLPESLETISSYAFCGCSNLSEIHIPSMLKSIGDNAFTGCTRAKDVYAYTLSPISINQNSFIYDGVTLHAPQVPESVFWDYYTNTQWSQFTNVVPFDAKYQIWYMGENQDIVLEDGETIPNEDGEQAEGEMSPGSGLTYLPGSFQWLDKLKLKWKGGKFPAFIDNGSVFVDELTFLLDVQAGKWYFFCFPFDIELDKAKFNGKFVWRYYDGDERASNGVGGWKNIGGNKLNAFQGYIFQTNKSGEIELTITDPMFTGGDKDINFEGHASSNVQDAGWNFVGNPNLSYYDLSCFIDNFKCPITVWDPVNNTYNAITPGDDDYTFHPFEAFFIQKPADTESMTFESENRETSTQAEQTQQSRRRARAAMPIDESRRIVNLTLSDGTHTDKTRVVFNDEKALGYEPECDAAKFFSTESVPQLYTLDATTAEKPVKFAINERPQADLRVALGVSIPADGTYTIASPRMDQPMALLDRETGTLHDFNADGDYTFMAKAGSHEDRFVLMPASSPTGVNALQTAGIKLEVCDGGLSIAGLAAGTTATVYNAAGVMVASMTESGHCSLTPGTYVVTVGELTSKVVVK